MSETNVHVRDLLQIECEGRSVLQEVSRDPTRPVNRTCDADSTEETRV